MLLVASTERRRPRRRGESKLGSRRMSFMTEIASYVLGGLESLQEKRLRVSLKIYNINRYGRTIQNQRGET